MRYVKVWVGGKNIANQKVVDDDSPSIVVQVDGKPLKISEVPEPAVKEEPREIGAQVWALSTRWSNEQVYTKISPTQWVAAFGRDTYGNPRTDVAHWSELAVFERIDEEPEPERLQEPKGLGAVISGDCYLECGDEDVFFVKTSYGWQCQACGGSYSWDRLVKAHGTVPADTIIIHSEGFGNTG